MKRITASSKSYNILEEKIPERENNSKPPSLSDVEIVSNEHMPDNMVMMWSGRSFAILNLDTVQIVTSTA